MPSITSPRAKATSQIQFFRFIREGIYSLQVRELSSKNVSGKAGKVGESNLWLCDGIWRETGDSPAAWPIDPRRVETKFTRGHVIVISTLGYVENVSCGRIESS